MRTGGFIFIFSPTLHNEAPTQLLHLTNIFTHYTQLALQNALIHTPILSHTLPASPPNKISALHSHIVASISDNFPGFHALSSPAPFFFIIISCCCCSLPPPPPPLYISNHSFQQVLQAGREGGRVVLLALVISFRSFQPAAAKQNPNFLQLKCVPTASPRRGGSLVYSTFQMFLATFSLSLSVSLCLCLCLSVCLSVSLSLYDVMF